MPRLAWPAGIIDTRPQRPQKSAEHMLIVEFADLVRIARRLSRTKSDVVEQARNRASISPAFS
jgi:hypothetical protein